LSQKEATISGGLSRFMEVGRVLIAKDAAHNPNHRIAIGVFDRCQNAEPD